MNIRSLLAFAALLLGLGAGARAETVTIACGAVGIEYRLCREGAEAWAAASGNAVTLIQSPSLTNDRLGLFQQLLAARSPDIDVFQIDIIWPAMLGRHFVDPRRFVPAKAIGAHFPRLIAAYTVKGVLKAMPWFADVGVLYYRRDLLDKYGLAPPASWDELARTARRVVDAEHAAGNADLVGLVFQGRAYEGLTVNALEWMAAAGGGAIVDASGSVTLDNPAAAAAIDGAARWIGTIAPRGVLAYAEEEARGVFQSGRALFMRNWPYAWPLLEGPGSPVRGRVGVAPLPGGGVLGGGGLAVSAYSAHPALAADLVAYLTGRDEQRRRARIGGFIPTIAAVYDAPAPATTKARWRAFKPMLDGAIARPARIVGDRYNQVSAIFWNAVHDTLAGRGAAAENLARAARRIERLRRGGKW